MSTHRIPPLWFRLDEVHALAEHALACPEHHLTLAEIRSGYPRRGPALTWDGQSGKDQLRSNGTPAWYGRDGDSQHAAHASTWMNTATGRRGTPAQPGHDTAYLPLTADDRKPSLIDQFRAARDHGLFWVTLTADAEDGALLSAEAIGITGERGDLAPPEATWIPAVVTLDQPWERPDQPGQLSYPAMVPDSYSTSDGYAIPRFDRATVEAITADLDAIYANTDPRSDPMPGEHPVLHFYEQAPVLVIAWQPPGVDDPASLRITDLITPDADGLYAVGTHQWPWTLTGEAPAPAPASAGSATVGGR